MGIKPFDIRSIGRTGIINPEQIGYQDSLDIISEELHRTRRSFVKIGWYLKHIREKEMYREENYTNIYELAADKFNLSQPTATRFMNICEQFSIGHDSPELDEQYIDFSMSQLFEMLPMKPEEINKITPDMTITQIRDFKKKGKGNIKSENEDIPGQTSIQEDFEEFMPDNYQKEVVDAMCCEVPQEPKDGTGMLQPKAGMSQPHDEEWVVKEFERMRPAVSEEIREVYYGEDDKKKRAKAVQEYDPKQKGEIWREEELSAYGLPKTAYPEGSLLTTEGCGNKHDCFSCAMDGCNIRQKSRYCREAPFGSPFACKTMEVLDDIRRNPDVKDRCQFLNNSMAYHMPGSGKASPCCKECQEACDYRCARSLKSIKEEKKKAEEAVRPGMPELKNNAQRQAWLRNYKEWGLWYRDENIDVNYYKYDFPEGSRLIVAEYPKRLGYWREEAEDEYFFHLLEKDKEGYGQTRYDEKYRNATDSETYLVEFLKKLQKK